MTDHSETIEALQRELAEREAQHQRSEKIQAALYEIAAAAGAVTDVSAFYTRLHEIVGGLIYAKTFWVASYDEQSGMLSWPYWTDASGDPHPQPAALAEFKGVTGYVFKEHVTFHISRDWDALIAAGAISLVGQEAEDGIFVPLMDSGRILGVLSVQSYELGIVYSEQDVQLLEFVAQHISTALTRARAIEETLQRNNELAILNSVGEAMAKTLDVKTVTRIVGDKVRDIFDAESVAIRLVDPGRSLIDTVYEFDKGEGGYLDSTPPIPLGKGLTSKVMESRRPLLLGTMDEQIANGGYVDPEQLSQGSGILTQSWLGLPIISADKVLGVVSVANYQPHAFGQSQLRLLQTLSASMGVAIENARLFEAEQQRIAELQIINSIQQALASKLDPQSIYELIGQKLGEIFHQTDVGIGIYDPVTDTMTPVYTVENGQRLELAPRQVNGVGFTGDMLRRPRTILLNENMAEEMKKVGSYVIDGSSMSKSMLRVPLMTGGKMSGILELLDMHREHAFGEADVRLLETLAGTVSVALENVRLFDETQRLFKAEQQRAAELAIINSVQEGLASKLDMQAIYDLVGERIHQVFPDAQAVAILTYDQEADLFHPRYVLEKGQRYDIQPWKPVGFRKHVLETREPMVINRDAERLAAAFDNPIIVGERGKSSIFVPMVVGGKATGIIELQHMDREDAFAEADVRLLQTLANSMSVALENARLFDEVQKRNQEITAALEQQTATSSILSVMASSPTDVQPVLDAVAQSAARLCESYDAAIARVEGDVFKVVAHWGPVPVYEDQVTDGVPLNRDSVTGRAIVEARTIHVEDVLAEPESEYPLSKDYSKGDRQRTLLATPLLREGKAIGAIFIRRQEVNPFTEKQATLLRIFADQAAIAIENVRLFDETTRLLKETEQRAAELAIINSVQEGLASKLDIGAIYELVGEKIREIFDAQAVLVGSIDYVQHVRHMLYGWEKGQRLAVQDAPFNRLTEVLVESKQPVVINENAEAALVKYGMALTPGTEIAKSLIFVPILTGGRATGYVSLQNIDRESAFSDSDVRLLTTLTSSMSVALENARLFDETQRLLKETEQRAAELGIINSVQEGLASKLEMQAVYDLVGSKVGEIFHADTTYIMSYDAAGPSAYSHYYVDKGQRVPMQSLPLGVGLYSKVIESRQPVVIGTADEGHRLGSREIPTPETGKDLNQSGIYVPMMLGAEVKGVVSVQSYAINAFTENDVRLLTTLANSMSVALENARLFDETQRLLKETQQRAAELAIINSVQAGLASKIEMQAIYDLVGDKIREIFDAESMLISIFDEKAEMDYSVYDLEDGERQYPDPSPLSTFQKRLLQTREVVLINENLAVRGPELGQVVIPGTAIPKSGVWVPLLAGGRVRGVISLQNMKREHAFLESDVRLLETLANSMSVALENARLFDETQRLLKETEQRAAELTIINSVQDGLASKLNYQAVIELVGEKIRELFHTDNMSIRLYDRTADMLTYPYIVDAGKREQLEPQPLGTGLTAHIIHTQQALVINEDLEQRMAELGSNWIGTVDAEKDRSFVGIPIQAGDEAIGIVACGSKQEHAFSDSDVRLLHTLTNSMGVALENARLFDETQRLLKETEQRAAELAIINSVQEGLASKLEMQSIYDLVGDKIRDIFNAQSILIVTYDKAADTSHFAYNFEKGVRYYPEPRPTSGITGHVIHTRQPVLINSDYLASEARILGTNTEILAGEDIKARMDVPLIVGGEATGVISLQNIDRENAFSESDLRLLQTLANSMSVALENARLFDETQRLFKAERERAAELQIINSIQEGLASKLELQSIIDLVGGKLREVLHTDEIGIRLYDEQTNLVHYLYEYEHGERLSLEARPPSALFQEMRASRLPIMGPTVEITRKYQVESFPGSEISKSLASVPIVSGSRVIGNIAVEDYEREDAYNEANVRLLQTIASSMGVALENARLFDETQRLFKAEQQRAAELSAISAVSQALVAETDLDKMIELIGEKMRETFHADIAYLALLDRATDTINFPYVYGEEFRALKFGEGLTSKIIQTGQPLLINRDIATRRAELGTAQVGKQARSYLGVPIQAGGQAIGVISVQSLTEENAFDEDDLRLLTTVAANAGAAIRNAQLHAETQRRAQEMATLAEIGNDIAASRELVPVLERIAAHVMGVMKIRDIAIRLLDADGRSLYTSVALGVYPEQIKASVLKLGEGVTGAIAKSGVAEIVSSPDRDPRAHHIVGTPQGEDAHESLMVAPLISRGKTIGVINVWRPHADGLFVQSELDFLVSVARQTAIAIESARLYLETQRRANEMSALAEVGREISSTLDPVVVLERITARAKDLLSAEDSAVYLMEPDHKAMRAITALGPMAAELKSDLVHVGEGIIGGLAREARAEFVNDVLHDPRALMVPGTEDLEYDRIMAAPLLKGDEVIGMMVVWRTTDPFNPVDLNFLEGLARQGAIGLENARLFEEIKRQGQYLETIFSNSPVAIITVDDAGKVLSWSPAAEKLFGYTREEAIGRDVDSLVANSSAVEAEARAYTHDGMDSPYVHVITKRTRKDGTLIDVDLSALPLPLEGGKSGVVAIYNDVGEIQRQRQYYEAIVQNSPVAIVTLDDESKVISWNPGAEQLFGYTRDEAIGANVDDMVAALPELRAGAEQYADQARVEKLHVITRRTRKDRSLIDVELSGVPLPTTTGQSGLIAIYHDITELQRARQEAVAANEAKSAFLATMSHEIRTPMNAVIGMSGLLMDTQLNKEQHDYAETIRNSGDALLAIINDILDFSKIEAGKMDLERQPFDLRECVESALDLVAGRAVEKNIDLAYIIDDDVPAGIRGDVTRLRQILLNLLSNAVKFTEKGEVVLTVKVDKDRDCLLFAVRDTGIGIPSNRMDRLFASFSQADSSTTRRYGGTGLGLAISKRLAEMMGGDMWAESSGAGKGSTFSFTMRAESAKVTERKTAREMRGLQPALQSKRVLIVDDNETNRRILTIQTEKWGMQPRATESPREALRWLKRGEPFDLAVLDLQMPEMDGVMLTRELRQFKRGQTLPVVLLTSLGRKEVGADDVSFAAYLTKPLKPSALFDVLAGIFARNLVAPKPEAAKAAIDTEMARNHPLRILLAEDNAVNQKLALRLLEQMGYRADVASNGLEAVESLERQMYDVVLMDVQMPEMDGLDATRTIRKLRAVQQPRIVAMTANAMQGDREMCIAAGMDDYISKPIRVAELSHALLNTQSFELKQPVAAAKKTARTATRKTASGIRSAKKPARVAARGRKK